MRNFTNNNIEFTENFCIKGALIVLFPKKENTKEEIKIAKAQLKNERDCAQIRVANSHDIADRFNTELFRHPRVKGLSWYQVDNDTETILNAIRKGIEVEDYVKDYVLPRIKITEQMFLERYGESIYSF